MKVSIPQPLRSYTGETTQVEADGGTIGELLRDLDRQFPGIRFRMVDEQDAIRKHMKLFVNRVAVRDLERKLEPGDEVQILQALSGG
jgi:molybdopterin converting factor small subunit